MEPAGCQVRVEGGVMDEQIDSKQRPPEQLPSSEEEWRRRLTPDQFEVLRNKGTERAFTGKYAFTKDRGTYRVRTAEAAARVFPHRVDGPVRRWRGDRTFTLRRHRDTQR